MCHGLKIAGEFSRYHSSTDNGTKIQGWKGDWNSSGGGHQAWDLTPISLSSEKVSKLLKEHPYLKKDLPSYVSDSPYVGIPPDLACIISLMFITYIISGILLSLTTFSSKFGIALVYEMLHTGGRFTIAMISHLVSAASFASLNNLINNDFTRVQNGRCRMGK